MYTSRVLVDPGCSKAKGSSIEDKYYQKYDGGQHFLSVYILHTFYVFY